MTLSPPRQQKVRPRRSLDEVAAVQALREQALIEEARRRARRRRRLYAAAVVTGITGLSLYVAMARSGAPPTVGAGDGPPLASSAQTQRLHNGKIAFSAPDGNIEARAPSGGSLQTLVRCPSGTSFPVCDIPSFTWSHDGTRLAFLRGHFGGAVKTSSYAVFTTDLNGRHTRRYVACGTCGTYYASSLSWSPDNSKIALTDDLGLVVVNVKTGRAHSFAPCVPPCVDVNPTWSPDGSKIAFGQGQSLFVASGSGTNVHRVATTSDVLAHPSWSPDGKQIAFDGADTIYTVDADGMNLTALLRGSSGSGPGVPSWSPDGRRLVYFNTPGVPGAFGAEVWVMNADGSDRHRLYHSRAGVGTWSAPQWSPDGKRIAFSADTAEGLVVMNADGSGRELFFRNASNFAWQPLK